METASVVARRWQIFSIVFMMFCGLAIWNQVSTTPSFFVTGTARVAQPETDLTRPSARTVDLDELVTELTRESIQQELLEGRDEPLRVFRIGDGRIQVSSPDTDGVPVVGRALERLADEVSRQQVDAGIDADDRITPRLFIRVPDRSTVSSVGSSPPEVVGTLLLEDPRTSTHVISSVRMGARLLQVLISGDANRSRLAEELGVGADYSFQLPRRGADGLMDISVTAADSDTAVEGFGHIVGFLEKTLEERQADASVPLRDQFIIEVVAAPLEADRLSPAIAPTTLLIVIAGLLLAIAAATAWDRRHLRLERVGGSDAREASDSCDEQRKSTWEFSPTGSKPPDTMIDLHGCERQHD